MAQLLNREIAARFDEVALLLAEQDASVYRAAWHHERPAHRARSRSRVPAALQEAWFASAGVCGVITFTVRGFHEQHRESRRSHRAVG